RASAWQRDMDPTTLVVFTSIGLVVVLAAWYLRRSRFGTRMEAWPEPAFRGRHFRSLAVFYPVFRDLVARADAEKVIAGTMMRLGAQAQPLIDLVPPTVSSSAKDLLTVLEAHDV